MGVLSGLASMLCIYPTSEADEPKYHFLLACDAGAECSHSFHAASKWRALFAIQSCCDKKEAYYVYPVRTSSTIRRCPSSRRRKRRASCGRFLISTFRASARLNNETASLGSHQSQITTGEMRCVCVKIEGPCLTYTKNNEHRP